MTCLLKTWKWDSRSLRLKNTYSFFRRTWGRGFTSTTMMKKTNSALYFLKFEQRYFTKKMRAFMSSFWNRENTNIPGSPPPSDEKKQQDSVYPFPESALAHKYCVGKGLEIGGSAHNPFGLNTLNVDFTDSMDTIYKKEEIKNCGKAMKVDIVAYGDDIPLPDESQDFIVSSHIIEHFPNPIKALLEWDRLVRPGGIIFMIVPHKERTFDKERECTWLEHLIEDFHNNDLIFNPNVHEHCWSTETFLELIEYMIKNLGMKWEIVEVQDVDDKVGNGFTLVIRKVEKPRSLGYVR